MKRLSALILCAILSMSALNALALGGNTMILSEGAEGAHNVSVESIAYLNGTLYIMDYGKLYTYDGTLNSYNYALESQTDGASANLMAIVADENAVRALVYERVRSDDTSSVVGLLLYTLELTSDGKATFKDPVSMDPLDLIEYYDNDEYMRALSYPFMQDGKLILMTYADYGEVLMAYDFDKQKFLKYDVEYLDSVAPYKAGLVLVTSFNYDQASPEYWLSTLDLDTGDISPLFEVELVNDMYPYGFAYDAGTGNLYYQMNGEIYRIQNMQPETAMSVNAAVLRSTGASLPVITEEGAYIACDYGTVVMRSTDPAARPARKLSIAQRYIEPIENAFYAFESAHPDVEMRFAQNIGDITQALLTRDSSVDVYYVDAASQEYAAMYERGYLAELTSSAKLSALVNGMYPALRDIAQKDGALYALPVDLNMYGNMGMRRDALEALGLSEADMPTTWTGLFEFFNAFPEISKEHPNVKLCRPDYSREMFQSDLFFNILQTCIIQAQASGGAQASFDTQTMRDILSALENLDYEALGISETGDDSMPAAGEMELLSESVWLSARVNADSHVPLALGLGEGDARIIRGNLGLLVVNPYSQNIELAIEFLETVADHMPALTLVEFSEHRDEPLPNERYETVIQDRLSSIDALKESLAKLTDDTPVEFADSLKQRLRAEEESLEEYRTWGKWTASAESIARYRKYAGYITPFKYFGVVGKGTADIETFIAQYMGGVINADTMLREIEKRIKMMMQEGV